MELTAKNKKQESNKWTLFRSGEVEEQATVFTILIKISLISTNRIQMNPFCYQNVRNLKEKIVTQNTENRVLYNKPVQDGPGKGHLG